MRKRARLLKRWKQRKKIAETIGIISGFTAVFLMGGVDSENWIPVALTLLLFMGIATVSGLIAQEYGYRIRRVTGGEPWRRGILR